jgi:hypothetical protein
MSDEAPTGVQVHESGRWYHTNCGGEVVESVLRAWDGAAYRSMECEKCAARWTRGTWRQVRMGKLTWDLPSAEKG